MNEKKMARVALIGATGSVGRSVVQVCRSFPDRFSLHSMAACRNGKSLLKLQEGTECRILALTGEDYPGDLETQALDHTRWICGEEALEEIATDENVDSVVVASSGIAAVGALLAALRAGKRVYLANKESLIAAGKWIIGETQYENQLLPLDSEHNAIWQCLGKRCNSDGVKRLILTASGGPFLDWPIENLSRVRVDDVMKHPVWSMGRKITVDSATMMNKGFEIIEAGFFFQCEPDRIFAVIHPESRVHGMVDYLDGTRRMAAFAPDMRIPILSALAYPDTVKSPFDADVQTPFPEAADLSFRKIDMERFPCFRMALEAFKMGGGYPAFLVGVDEGAVSLFLQGKISYSEIPKLVEDALAEYSGYDPGNWEEAVAIVGQGRQKILEKSTEKEKRSGMKRGRPGRC
jgi:1-deoxy-D-xylulose-5-phosphate reductoisomerase